MFENLTELRQRGTSNGVAERTNKTTRYTPLPQREEEALSRTIASRSVVRESSPAMQAITDLFAYCKAKTANTFEEIDFDSLSENYLFQTLRAWMDDDHIKVVVQHMPRLLPKLSEQRRFELAKHHKTLYYGFGLLNNLKTYDLEEPHRFELLQNTTFVPEKLTVSFDQFCFTLDLTKEHFLALYPTSMKCDSIPFDYLKTLKLTIDESFALATSLAIRHGKKISPFVPQFNLTSEQRAQVYFAQYFGSLDPLNTISNLYYKFLNEKNSSNLVNTYGYTDIQYYSLEKQDYLNLFNILSKTTKNEAPIKHDHPQEYRPELALIFAYNQPTHFAENFERYQLTEDQLVEAVKSSLKKDVSETCNLILTRYQRRVLARRWDELFGEAFKLSPSQFCQFNTQKQPFPNFFNLMKAAAIAAPKDTAKNIRKQTFEEESEFLSIALLIAEKDGEAIGQYIHQFELTEPNRFLVAKTAKEQNSKATLFSLTNYELTQPHFNEIHNALLSN